MKMIQKLPLALLLMLLVACSESFKVTKHRATENGNEVWYWSCRHTTPIYKWGTYEAGYEFYGEGAEAKATAKCDELRKDNPNGADNIQEDGRSLHIQSPAQDESVPGELKP
jgi:hypothetical protein